MQPIHHWLQQVTQFLQKHHLKIATAESCTGGLLAYYLTSRPASSTWFDRGWVTYSNDAKLKQLGVSIELIHRFGVVSEEVAAAMVQGAIVASDADLAVSITGIAGPEGGSPENPVGTVCFGWMKRTGERETIRIQFPPVERKRICLLACCEALKRVPALF